MKLKHTNHFRPVLYAIFVLLVVFACQKINPFEDVELTVNTDIYKSPILLRFVDGNPDATKVPEGLTVTISGPDKDLVLNDAGGKDYTVAGNVLPLVLNKNVSPSQTKPINFTVAVSGTGYVSTSKTITVVSADSSLSFEIPLTSVNNPPHGAAAATKVLSLTAGETITVPATADKVETAQITIAPGTQVKDAAGNVINATTVKAQVVQYGTQNEEALRSFPGGFSPQNVATQNGTNTNGEFITAGFVAVDMEADGKKVTGFSKPIDIKVGVSAELDNPETGQKVREGDKIPTWSYESETGGWKEEGEAVVTKGSDGKLVASFKASHLSYWNIDWFYGLSFNRICATSFKLRVSSNITGYVNSYDYYTKMYIVQSNGTRIFRGNLYYFSPVNGAANPFGGNVPSGYRMQFEVYRYGDNAKIGGTDIFNPCGITQVPVTITAPSPPVYLDIDMDFTARCSNKNVNIKPSIWVIFYDITAGRWSWTYAISGKANIKLREGREHIFYTYYGGKAYSGNVTFGKNSSNIATSGGGTGISGTITYNNSTGKVNILASYIGNNCK